MEGKRTMAKKKEPPTPPTSLRRQAEERLRAHPPGPGQGDAAPQPTQSLVHELQVHQIELEMQNEELRRAQESLEASRARYFDLYDLAPVGYVTVGEQGLIVDANSTAATLLGVQRRSLPGRPITRFIFRDDQDIYYLHHSQLLKTGAPQAWELRMTRPGGERFWARMEAALFEDGTGQRVCRIALSDVSQRKQAELQRDTSLEELKAALAEKEVLMREIYHRVKNNVQALIYLMDMQAEYIADEDARQMIRELQERARAMALAHEQLYQSQNLAQIDFGDYLRGLVNNLMHAFGAGRPIVWAIDAADTPLSIDTAIPCGLIVNELLTNALKYAFPGSQPRAERGETECRITVAFQADRDRFTLLVADNGVGLPPGLDWSAAKTLGLTLINILARHQLGGQVEVDSRAGTSFKITFAERERKRT
jgi:PAS domain S-box-containing protein